MANPLALQRVFPAYGLPSPVRRVFCVSFPTRAVLQKAIGERGWVGMCQQIASLVVFSPIFILSQLDNFRKRRGGGERF